MWYWQDKFQEQATVLAALLREDWSGFAAAINSTALIPPSLKNYLHAYAHSQQGAPEKIPQTEILLRAQAYQRQKNYRQALSHYREAIAESETVVQRAGLRFSNPKYLPHGRRLAHAYKQIAEIMLRRGELIPAEQNLTRAVRHRPGKKEGMNDLLLRAEIELMRKVHDKIAPGGITESYDWVKKTNLFAKNSLTPAGAVKETVVTEYVDRYVKTYEDFELGFPERLPLSKLQDFLNHHQIKDYVRCCVEQHSRLLGDRYRALAPRIACVNALITLKQNKRNLAHPRVAAKQKNAWISAFEAARVQLISRPPTPLDCIILVRCCEELIIMDAKILKIYNYDLTELLAQIEQGYQQYLKDFPPTAPVLFRLAINYERQAQPARAAYYHYKAFQINPNHGPAQKRIKHLYKQFGNLFIAEENLRLSDIINS